MSNFTRTFTKNYDFDGDKVHVEMKRLKRAQALTLIPVVQEVSNAAESDDPNKAQMQTETAMGLMEIAEGILKDAIVKVSGLYFDDTEVQVGTEEFEEMLTSVYFMQLIMLIVNDLIEESFLGIDNQKKSGG